MSQSPDSSPLGEPPSSGHDLFLRGGAGPVRLGQYEVHERIGQGGMGAVYRALHVSLKRWVALKVLPPDRSDDPAAVARFQREMEAVGRLDHPHIVRATDAGQAGDVRYLVMELIDGVDLSRLVRGRGPLPVADACELVRQAAAGLQCVHENGLVHRDLKPSNLMVTVGGRVKILDLGLARLGGNRPSAQLTASHQAMGTADYMAPEQWEAGHVVDIRADLYSLGCTFYTLLTGRPPFGTAEYDSVYKKMAAHAHAPPPPVRGRRPDVPAAVAAVLGRLLAKDPADRYAAPAQLEAALAPFCVGADVAGLVRAVRQGPPGGMAGAVEPSTGGFRRTQVSLSSGPTPAATPTGRRPPGRLPRGAAVVAVALAALVGLAALLAPRLARRTSGAPETAAAPPRAPADNGPGPTPPSLDQLEPHVLHRLLERPSLPVGFDGPDPRLWRWDPGQHFLEVKGPGVLVFPVGSTQRSRFTLEVGISQSPWAGDVGVFWGYREDAAARASGTPGREFAWFQALVVGHKRGALGQADSYSVYRAKAALVYNGQHDLVANLNYIARNDVERLIRGDEHILAITVEQDRLKHAVLGAVPLTNLCSEPAEAALAAQPHRGALGVFSLGYRATFGNVRFVAHGKN